MKKLTKKAIKEAVRYMVMIDWHTAYRNTLDTEVLEAESLIEAMDEASEMFNDNVYMLAILEKTDEVVEGNGLVYQEIMRSRTADRWNTIKAEGYTEGSTWARYFFDDGDNAAYILTCAK